MPATLDIRHETLIYTAQFARPAFELWGKGGEIMAGMYQALAGYGVTLSSFQVVNPASSAADTVITVRIGTGSLRFAFDKLEISFSGFSEQEFQGIPKVLQASTGWLAKVLPQFQFASHRVFYFTHSFLKGGNVSDLLKTLSPTNLHAGGVELGNGIVFNYTVPNKKWITQITFDRSQHFPGALYLGLLITLEASLIDYEKMLIEGREYLAGILDEVGLELPELSASNAS